MAKGAAEPAEHDETVAGRARAAIAALQALLEGDIAACQRNGDIAADADPGKPAPPRSLSFFCPATGPRMAEGA